MTGDAIHKIITAQFGGEAVAYLDKVTFLPLCGMEREITGLFYVRFSRRNPERYVELRFPVDILAEPEPFWTFMRERVNYLFSRIR